MHRSVKNMRISSSLCPSAPDCRRFWRRSIGSIRSGKREGVPKLGNRVVVGCNAFVCGGITVGDDVLIAANAFVDFDVPSNSLVIGNPGVIRHKENPCKDYIKIGA